MSTSSLIYVQIIAATSSNAQLGLNPGGSYWFTYLAIFTDIWFATLLYIIFLIAFIIVIKIAYGIFFIKNI